MAIGCPAHSSACMDFDDAGVFCQACESAAAMKAAAARSAS